MRRLTRAPNAAIAQIWADLLCEAGLPATVQRQFLSSVAGELPPDQGKALIEGLGAVARVIEVAELQKAVEELREQMEGMRQ